MIKYWITIEAGNGDPSLAILSPYSPNHAQLARQFFLFDNFYDSGETSNTSWNNDVLGTYN